MWGMARKQLWVDYDWVFSQQLYSVWSDASHKSIVGLYLRVLLHPLLPQLPLTEACNKGSNYY